MGSRDHSEECRTCGYLRGGMNNDECECFEVREAAWQGPMYRDCGSCNFVRRTEGRPWCAWCGKELLAIASCLARNLRDASALCESFRQGSDHRMRMMLDVPVSEDWVPGCRRSAP